MPLTAEYTWAESETVVQLQVPLRGQAKSKVDVFATECYLKISFQPYLLELDLHGCIDSVQPKARIENGILFIKAKKKEGNLGLWGSLGHHVDRKCEPKIRARREDSIKEHLKREQELKERISLRKHEDERLALRSQMNVEEAERRLIEDLKAEAKEKAEAEVYSALAELAAKQDRGELSAGGAPPRVAQPKQKNKTKHVQRPPSSASTTTELKSKGTLDTIQEDASAEDGSPVPERPAAASANVVDRPIWDEARIQNKDGGRDYNSEEEDGDTTEVKSGVPHQDVTLDEVRQEHNAGDDDDEVAVSYIPAPRVPAGVVPIGFTTRLFPTPLRESKVAGESAWIMKNRKHLHKNKTLVGRLPLAESKGGEELYTDVCETDPIWLKGKGDDLYRGGDFLGAINAYTSALDADPSAAGCLSNRAACHLCLGQASKCVADCGAALQIFQKLPETGPNQARALARRALAYRELGHYRSSLEDFLAALEFSPADHMLQEETARAEPLALCETAKKEAVKRFASGDIAGACKLYTDALAAVPAFPSCLSNRAACYLALGRPQECVHDCTAVLQGLCADPLDTSRVRECTTDKEQSPAHVEPVPVPPPGSVPPAGSEKRRRWVLTTLLRRGRANIELGRLESALRDYRAARSLVPDDKAVEGDILELERLVNEAGTPLTH